jgi:sulfite exporter TauE/SafE/copper chaperone CopZ
MSNATTETRLHITGMTCGLCVQKIEAALQALPGVSKATVQLARGTARIVHDPEKVKRRDLIRAVVAEGYGVGSDAGGAPGGRVRSVGRIAAVLSTAGLLYLLLSRFGVGAAAGLLPLAEEGMGYGMLFVIGLITSVHCVMMCGGIGLSQCMRAPQPAPGGVGALKPSALYNLGRVISYTLVGALVGAAGSVISFSQTARGVVQAVAGVFMLIMGLNMTGLFPWMARLVPRMPKFAAQKIGGRGRSMGPLYVGLINGLMPCGPLQAMQIYALSTGDPAKGALSMLVFSLGTVPLMFGFGALGSIMNRRFSRRAMAVGAVLVAALGLTMLSSGMNLAGASFPTAGAGTAGAPTAARAEAVQRVTTTLRSGSYEPITVTAGVPVEWTINAPKGSINGCNNRMILPAFGIEHSFEPGANVIRFTPEKAGRFRFSCWMGMITSTVTVIDNTDPAAAPGAETADPAGPDWLTNAEEASCCEAEV